MKITFNQLLLSKKIKYTRHAKNRMRWRRISIREIELAFKNPDTLKKINTKYVCLKKIKKKNIKIYFTLENNQIVIISVFDAIK